MNQEKWEQWVEIIRSKFSLLEEGEEVLGKDEKSEFYVFESPLGELKLERITRPKLLDKQTFYSNRKGSEASVRYVFSEDEVVDRIRVSRYGEQTGEWEEIDAGSLF